VPRSVNATPPRLAVRYHRSMKAGDDPRTGRWAVALVGLVGLVTSCADDGAPGAATPADVTASSTSIAATPTSAPTTSAPTTSASTTTTISAPTTTTTPATTTTEPEIVIPEGILAAMPTQNRVDPAKGQFQVKIFNRTDERFTVVGVQFVWEGYTTPVTERHDIVVKGQRIDFPVKFPGATCVGDGTRATMPDPDTATVRLILEDGSERTVPVFDVDHLARRLYLEDCERQTIESLVAVELVDLHEVEFDGRPVTEGSLRLTRRLSTSTVSVQTVSNNILFVFEAPAAPTGGPVVTLDEGADEASAPIRFVESRCDPHAISEASQPFKFVAQIDLGGGDVHPFILSPPVEAQIPMRQTMEAGCEALGKIVFAGEE
jgi:hypothetical protein